MERPAPIRSAWVTLRVGVLHRERMRTVIAALAAAWTNRPRFARKRYQPVEAAVAAAKPCEPTGWPATPQEVPERLLDEPRQAFSVAQTRGLHAEGFEMIAHDLVERALRGTPRFVGRRKRGHSRPESGRRASDRSRASGRTRSREYPEVAGSARWPAVWIAVPAHDAIRANDLLARNAECELLAVRKNRATRT